MTADVMPATSLIRVAGVYATKWRFKGEKVELSPAESEQDLLKDFYEFFQDERPRLPRPISYRSVPPGAVTFNPVVPLVQVVTADMWLFVLPSDQIVAACALGLHCLSDGDPAALAQVLERCTFDQLCVNGSQLADYFATLVEARPEPRDIEIFKAYAPKKGAAIGFAEEVLLPERHLIVMVPSAESDMPPSEATIEQILYRDKPPYQKEFTQRDKPDELNEDGTVGVVTTYVSFLYGHGSVVRNSVFFATVQAIGTASRFRQIWDEAYYWVREFRRDQQQSEVGKQQRKDMEKLVDRLGNLEFDLTFSVEFPLMRIESVHTALSKVLDLGNQAQTLSQMFTQLGGSVRSEITAIDIRDRREADAKQQQNNFATTILTVLGVSLGFVLAFFGINASQVDQSRSMFSAHYVAAYAIALVLGLVPIVVISYFRWRAKRIVRKEAEAAK